MLPSFHNAGRLIQKVQPEQKYDLREQRPDPTPYLIRLLQKNKDSQKPVLEILCLDSGYTYDKKMGFVVLDMGGRVRTIGEFLDREYGVRRDSCKCPYCDETQQTDTILPHILEGFGEKGHHLGIVNVIEFFKKTLTY